MAETAKVISLRDRLVDFVTGLGGSRDRTTTQSFGTVSVISLAEIENMYRTSWEAAKIVDIVPQDMVRAGRHWQASSDVITLLESYENRPEIQYWSRVHECLVRARLTGSSGLYIGIRGADPTTPLDFETVGRDDLEYLTVLSREEMGHSAIEHDPASPWRGLPKMWQISNSLGQTLEVHPSRIVFFTGRRNLVRRPTDSTALHGDSILQIVYEAVRNAASTQQHVAGLVPDARTDVIYIPGLGEILKSDVETKKLIKRFQLFGDMRSMYRISLLEGNGQSGSNGRGEKWEHRQVSFSNLPDLIRTYLQIAAGAADIPVTRFLGESPAGENSTGESDMRNYYDHIGALQRLKLAPALRSIDECLIRAATGGRDERIYYKWAPLWALKETEKADIFQKKADAIRKIAGGGKDLPLIDLFALSESTTNTFVEDGSLPGLEEAVKKHGTLDRTVPDLQSQIGKTPEPKALPVADAKPRTLYVRRALLNTSEFLRWASDQGFVNMLKSDDLHVTVVYSRTPVDWMKMGEPGFGRIVVPAGGPRAVERLGETATVLLFSSSMLSWRHREMIEAGATSEYEEYVPHVTISHAPQTVDLDKVVPFRGELRFGPEIFEEVREDA